MSNTRFTVATLILSACVISAFGTFCYAEADRRHFIVFDATGFTRKPRLEEHGMQPLLMVYEQDLWPKNQPREGVPHRTAAAWARWAARHEQLLCLNVELWQLEDKDDIETNLRNLVELVRAVHDERPGVRCGFFSIVPTRRMAATPFHEESWDAFIDEYQKVLPFLQEVDVLFPSLYMKTTDPDEWERYAVRKLQHARRFGKKVYPFLWPRYHPLGDKEVAYQLVPGDLWKRQLEVCLEHADGVVIWHGRAAWDETAEWWPATKAFIEEHLSDR